MSRYRIKPTAVLVDHPPWIQPGHLYDGTVDLLAGTMFNRLVVLEQPLGAGKFSVPERDLERRG